MDRKLALYFPGRVWTSSLPVRNLVLFFDGIAILNPPYQQELLDATPLADELRSEDLLTVYTPGELYDEGVVDGMTTFFRDVMAGSEVSKLAVPSDAPLGRYVVTDIGRAGALGPASDYLRETLIDLLRLQLIRQIPDPLRVVMHRDLRIAMLTQAAYLLGAREPIGGVALRPVTDLTFSASDGISGADPADPGRFSSTLLAAASADLAFVGVGERALAATPLRDLKRYREDNRGAYELYLTELHDYVQAISAARDAIFKEELVERRHAQLVSASESVRAVNRARWAGNIQFALSALTFVIPPAAGLVAAGPGGAIAGGAAGGIMAALGAGKMALEARNVRLGKKPGAFSFVTNLPKSLQV